MKLFALLFFSALAVTSVLSTEDEENAHWLNYKLTHQKKYASIEEEQLRKQIFLENLKFINLHNKRHDNGEVSFRVGANVFADMTNEEFRSKMLRPINPDVKTPADAVFRAPENVEDLPETVDWRTEGAVTPVKNQGSCGSCWAFSTVASVEGQHFLKTKKLVSLSEQNLVDCVNDTYTRGCRGGLMTEAFDYIRTNNGIDTEESYPYTGSSFSKCQFSSSNVGATVTGYVNITAKSEDDLKAAVATVGPVSVAIDAGHLSFQLYHSGVYRSFMCSSKYLNHGVTAVGYGTQGGYWIWSGDYWLVKNSWGTSWGEEGYIKMGRNHNNMCGIATMASYPLV